MNNSDPFSNNLYVNINQTATTLANKDAPQKMVTSNQTVADKDMKIVLTVPDSKYGVGKPKRVVIKGKIASE